MRINNDQVSSGVGIVLGLFIVLHSFSYKIGSFPSPGTGFFPLLAGVCIIFLSVIGLISGTLCGRKGEGWQPVLKGKRWDRPLIVLLSLFAYAFLVKYLGFTITTFIYLGFLFRVTERLSWAAAIFASATIALVSYFLFVVLLETQLPKGVVGF
jgi:hypothetical protein